MTKPELVIESQPDDGFVLGVCSACPQVHPFGPSTKSRYLGVVCVEDCRCPKV